MTQGHRTLKERMHSRLMLAVRWVSGAELAAGLSTSRVAIEDALADLVTEGLAEFEAELGYRLSGSQLCRDVVRDLRLAIARSEQKNKFRRLFQIKDFGEVMRVGVAEHRPSSGLLVYELELPFPGAEESKNDINKRVEVMLNVADTCMKEERKYA